MNTQNKKKSKKTEMPHTKTKNQQESIYGWSSFFLPLRRGRVA